jgi:FtsZ-interacting cell division protein YlmF
MESESDSVASEDDAGKKEEMKRSIFMKRKSDETTTSTTSPAGTKTTSESTTHHRSSKLPSNPFTFKDTKKIAQEILNRKKEEMNVQTPKGWPNQ